MQNFIERENFSSIARELVNYRELCNRKKLNNYAKALQDAMEKLQPAHSNTR